MLSDSLKAEIQTAYTQFLSGRGLRARYGQRLMIAQIARQLMAVAADEDGRRRGGNHLCVVEAGTGTGKTLAYTLAAVPVARALGKRLVIATATVALQEQVLGRDLPDIIKHSGLHFTYTLAKGRGRYLCLSRLDQVVSGAQHQSLALYPDEAALQPDAEALDLYQRMMDALIASDWAGDRDDWPQAIPDEQWQRVTTDHARCTGRRCSHIRQCSFFQARDRIADVDVIVANHDLVLADIALGGGAILPAPEDAIYIFDEAHHLPDKVIQHFSHRVRLGAGLYWLEQSERALLGMVARIEAGTTLRSVTETLVTQLAALRGQLAELRPQLEKALQDSGDSRDGLPILRYRGGVVPQSLRAAAGEIALAYGTLIGNAEQLVEELGEAIDKRHLAHPREELEEWLSGISGLQRRAESHAGLWRAYQIDGSRENPPQARWLQGAEGVGGQLDIDISCSPILAANTLVDTLWARCYAAVLTSATLTALGNFDRFSTRAGLHDDADFQVVPSPFRYDEAAELHIPALACDAGDAEAHTAALIAGLPTLIDPAEGTLVLFASRRQMENVFDALPENLRERILIQGVYAKHVILRRHCERIDGGEGSVIFGLASFAEGVDLPGDHCRHVIIAKIPFAVPDEPVEQALAEWIEANKGNAFFEVTVPDAALRLVQASGRLLRNEQDRGRITVLDRRLVTRPYGRRMLDSLPPYRRVIE